MKKLFIVLLIILVLIVAGFFVLSNFMTNSCDKISDQIDKDICYRDAAIAKNDLELCKKIFDQTDKYICYLSYYENLAIKSKNILACEKSSDDYYERRRCYLESAKVINDPIECDKINESDESAIKNDCFQEIAVLNQELSICDKIENQVIKDSCIWNVARVKNDISICEKISVLEDKEWCYHEIAQLNKNPAICDKISSTTAKDKCNECLKGENSSCNIS